jgi:hypothetical protein
MGSRGARLKVCAATIRAAAVLLIAATASAQSVPREPDPPQMRLRLGPVLLNPTFSLTHAGIDDNVFNEAESSAPESDFTIGAAPRVRTARGSGSTTIDKRP